MFISLPKTLKALGFYNDCYQELTFVATPQVKIYVSNDIATNIYPPHKYKYNISTHRSGNSGESNFHNPLVR